MEKKIIVEFKKKDVKNILSELELLFKTYSKTFPYTTVEEPDIMTLRLRTLYKLRKTLTK